MTFKLRTAAVAAISAALMATTAGVGVASAETLIPGVTGCDAPGGQQLGGAVLGGVAGALLGSGVSRHGEGTVPGALVGAALGSYVGCTNQRARAAQYPRYERAYYAPARPAYVRHHPRTVVRYVPAPAPKPAVRYRAWGE